MTIRISLRSRLMSFLIIIIVVLSSIAISAYTAAYRYVDEFQNTLTLHYQVNSLLQELRHHNSLLSRILTSDATIAFLPIHQSNEKLSLLMKDVGSKEIPYSKEYFLIHSLENALAMYILTTKHTLAEYLSDEQKFYPHYYYAQRIFSFMQQYCFDLQSVRLTNGWLYYYKLSLNADLTRRIIITILVIVLFVSLRFAYIFARTFTAPIYELASLSQRLSKGELSIPVIQSKASLPAEIVQLNNSFNSMSNSLRTLIHNLENKSQIEKKLHSEEMEKETTLRALREAQLLNLQTQIKPHFFFNTLNTILRQAQLEKAQTTAQLIQSLSNMFRYTLVSNQREVFLEAEIAIIEEYLSLQKKRFGKRISYSINNSVKYGICLIPPLTLQPFIENSICHGIEPLIDGGGIHFVAKEHKNYCKIQIADSGIGMNAQTLQRLLNPTVHSNGEVHGIGIHNIVNRLTLFYGSKARIKIYSKPNRGTLVILEIPFLASKEIY